MVAQRDDWLSVEEFLALDRESLDQKYEYRNGRMIAMAGGSKHHGMLISNLHLILGNHLKGSPCFVFTEMTLKLEDRCPLPDVMVTCDEKDLAEDENPTYIEHPKLVIEVLSPSTEKDDRGEKFLKYTYCPSIQEYVLINYEYMLVQVERRQGMQWLTTWFKQGENVDLQSIGLTVPVEEIYDRVALPPFEIVQKYKRQTSNKER
ncbi:MAG TPA: Uma2 family endonuclease [Ktedonobacteraceae bacterium]|jgi:Uma2 family endonuclease